MTAEASSNSSLRQTRLGGLCGLAWKLEAQDLALKRKTYRVGHMRGLGRVVRILASGATSESKQSP